MNKPTEGDGCPSCGCCQLTVESCEACAGDGVSGHDCGEDCCCCLEPEENVACSTCNGEGHFLVCIGGCDDGRHEAHTP